MFKILKKYEFWLVFLIGIFLISIGLNIVNASYYFKGNWSSYVSEYEGTGSAIDTQSLVFHTSEACAVLATGGGHIGIGYDVPYTVIDSQNFAINYVWAGPVSNIAILDSTGTVLEKCGDYIELSSSVPTGTSTVSLRQPDSNVLFQNSMFSVDYQNNTTSTQNVSLWVYARVASSSYAWSSGSIYVPVQGTPMLPGQQGNFGIQVGNSFNPGVSYEAYALADDWLSGSQTTSTMVYFTMPSVNPYVSSTPPTLGTFDVDCSDTSMLSWVGFGCQIKKISMNIVGWLFQPSEDSSAYLSGRFDLLKTNFPLSLISSVTNGIQAGMLNSTSTPLAFTHTGQYSMNITILDPSTKLEYLTTNAFKDNIFLAVNSLLYIMTGFAVLSLL